MEGKRLIRTLRLQNLLSFGPDSKEFILEPLNVLIGPNASGKSNLIEAIGLLAAAPNDLTVPIRKGGGISEWLWKGSKDIPVATIETTVDCPEEAIPLRYRISLAQEGQRVAIVDELLENERPLNGEKWPRLICHVKHGFIQVHKRDSTGTRPEVVSSMTGVPLEGSVLSPTAFLHVRPPIPSISKQFRSICLYRDWDFGPRAEARKPVPADLPGDFFDPETNNLSLVINDLEHRGALSDIIAHLKKFYEDAENITTRILGGTVQLFIHEKGLAHPIPASRLSDGTLRYLCLLTILCHPSPPPLVCIEEPELALHPDIIPTIAELLVEASQRTQSVVTTHSDLLVSALSETPEAVVVCEHDQDGTQLRRWSRKKLKKWLEKYSLGELWTKGEIGGTRW